MVQFSWDSDNNDRIQFTVALWGLLGGVSGEIWLSPEKVISVSGLFVVYVLKSQKYSV